MNMQLQGTKGKRIRVSGKWKFIAAGLLLVGVYLAGAFGPAAASEGVSFQDIRTVLVDTNGDGVFETALFVDAVSDQGMFSGGSIELRVQGTVTQLVPLP